MRLFHALAVILANGGAIASFSTAYANNAPTLDVEAQRLAATTNVRRSLVATTADFSPLTCNTPMADCVSFAASDIVDGKVTVECGTCLTFDQTDGGTVTLPNGLHIQGKVVFPNEARLTLETSSIIVEGQLVMTSTDSPVTGEPKIRVIMTGDQDVSFVPHSENAAACGGAGQACSVGIKPVVVAGGSVDVDGLPAGCPSWVTLQDVEEGDMPNSTSFDGPPSLPEGCSAEGVALFEDFSGGPNGWWGQLGATAEVLSEGSWDDGTSSYLKISGRKKSWQGPHYELRPVKDCLEAGTTLFLSAKMRLSNDATGTTSECSTSGENCPRFRISYMTASEQLVWNTVLQLTQDQVAATDGEWFDVKGEYAPAASHMMSNNVFLALSVEGPEGDIDISLGDIKLALPSSEGFATDPATACADLIQNGDAASGFSHPFRSFVKYNDATLAIATDDTTDPANAYFHLTGRTKMYSSITTLLDTSCAQPGATYSFSARVWVHSETPQTFSAALKTYKQGGGASNDLVAVCPPSSESIGWVTCTASRFVFEEVHSSARMIMLLFTSRTDDTSDVSYDDISFTYGSNGAGTAILPVETAACYGAGAEIVVPSSTLGYNNVGTGSIDSIDGTTGAVTMGSSSRRRLDSDSGILSWPEPASANPDFAGEVGFMSRNIVFESEAGAAVNQGGHFMVYRTEGGGVKLRGSVFRGFGQQGVAARYPINMHMSGDATGSEISHNVVRDSNQRCINIQGTNGVKVANNVAYSTKGHCYVLEDGSEVDNVFEGNLAALTLPVARANLLAGASDTNPVSFYIRNAANTFVGNHATGSAHTGFSIHPPPTVQGESASINAGYVPSEQTVKSFVDNVSHSNKIHGVSIQSYSPATESVLQNTRSYRNIQYGFSIRQGINIALEGGIASDNRIGIDLQFVSAARITNTKVDGLSAEYEDVIRNLGAPSHCIKTSTPPPMQGVRLHANAKDAALSGTLLSGMQFNRLNEASTGCPGSDALTINKDFLTDNYESPAKFEGLSFDDDFSMAEKMNLCDVAEAGIDNVMIEDDGALNPAGDGSPGYIVSDNPSLLSFATACSPMEGSCAMYCSGACMQEVTVETDPQATEGVVLRVTSGDEVVDVVGGFTSVNNYIDQRWTKKRLYSVALPAGNYDAIFKDSSTDATVWPKYNHVKYGEPPSCEGYMDSFTVGVPPTNEDTCSELIPNGSFEQESSEWMHNMFRAGAGLKLVSGGVGDTGHALATVGRAAFFDTVAMFLDTRCMKAGDVYSLDMKIQLWENGVGQVSCDPGLKTGTLVCPRASIKLIKDGEPLDYVWNFGQAVGPYEAGSWNTIAGEFAMDSRFEDADEVLLMVDRLRPDVELWIDDISLTPYVQTCDNVIKNGNFDDGNYRYWWYSGYAQLQMHSPGYGDVGFALSTVTRPKWYYGQSQIIDNTCLTPGTRYEVSAMVKLTSYEGVKKTCDPNMKWNSETRCPTVSIKLYKMGVQSKWAEFGKVIGPTSNDWNLIYGTFVATEDMVNADIADVYFARAYENIQMIVDNVEIKPASETVDAMFTCDNLIKNGDLIYQDFRYWDVLGGGQLEMFNNYAVRHTGRQRGWHGPRQMIDQDCLNVGDRWLVQAKLKLLDSDGNDTGCDKTKTFGITQCPAVTIYSLTPKVGVEHHVVTNEVPDAWNAGQWNVFSGVFEVTEQMTTLDYISAYVNKVNSAYDIVVDDFQITPVSL